MILEANLHDSGRTTAATACRHKQNSLVSNPLKGTNWFFERPPILTCWHLFPHIATPWCFTVGTRRESAYRTNVLPTASEDG